MDRARRRADGVSRDGAATATVAREGNDAHPRGIFEQMERYDPTTDSWITLEPLPIPVHGVTGAAFLDGFIHLPGGGTERGGNSGSTHHQVYRVTHSCGGPA